MEQDKDLEIKIEPDLLYCKVGGQFSFDRMLLSIDRLAVDAKAAGRDKVLLDCRSMEGELTEGERFGGGVKIAETFKGDIKVALLMPVAKITKLGELTAVNRGAKFLVTDSEDEARKFLSRG